MYLLHSTEKNKQRQLSKRKFEKDSRALLRGRVIRKAKFTLVTGSLSQVVVGFKITVKNVKNFQLFAMQLSVTSHSSVTA